MVISFRRSQSPYKTAIKPFLDTYWNWKHDFSPHISGNRFKMRSRFWRMGRFQRSADCQICRNPILIWCRNWNSFQFSEGAQYHKFLGQGIFARVSIQRRQFFGRENCGGPAAACHITENIYQQDDNFRCSHWKFRWCFVPHWKYFSSKTLAAHPSTWDTRFGRKRSASVSVQYQSIRSSSFLAAFYLKDTTLLCS